MKAPSQFRTERLLLRKPTLSDAGEIYRRYASDPEVTRYLSWPCHQSIDDTRAFIQFSDAQWRDQIAGPYLVESESGLLLGGTGLELMSPTQATTGYVFARDAWGQGYATEALRAMINLARQLGLSELHAHCHVAHTRSQRVLEKGGFVRKGPLVAGFPNLLPGEPRDAWRYELIWGCSSGIEKTMPFGAS